MKRIGPELKMPPVKVPGVLRELYEDLRDRRLLPLLALLLVAIVAVPLLLGGGSGEEEAPVLPPPEADAAAQASQLSVVEATPGLRDYRKRLRGRSSTDPFEQRYTAPVLSGADLPEESESSADSSGASSTSKSGEGSGSGTKEGGSGSGGEEKSSGGSDGGKKKSGGNSVWTVKLKVARTEADEQGKQVMGETKVRDAVRAPTPLPGEKTPVVTALGVNSETRKALFMISEEVTATYGDGRCISGGDRCELIELAAGLPQVFEFGANHARLKLTVVKVYLAPLGSG